LSTHEKIAVIVEQSWTELNIENGEIGSRSRLYQPEAFGPSSPGLGLSTRNNFCFFPFFLSDPVQYFLNFHSPQGFYGLKYVYSVISVIENSLNAAGIGKWMNQKYFTHRSVQIFKIFFRRFSLSRIWSSAPDHVEMVLLLNSAGVLRVEFLLKTESGYLRDAEVTWFTLANP